MEAAILGTIGLTLGGILIVLRFVLKAIKTILIILDRRGGPDIPTP